jgi:hypothetical protein
MDVFLGLAAQGSGRSTWLGWAGIIGVRVFVWTVALCSLTVDILTDFGI